MSAGAAPVPVPEIIIVDANVIINIAEGNVEAAQALLRRLRSGARVYISRAAYNEVVTGAETPELARQYDALLRDLKVQVPSASKDLKVALQQQAERHKFYADNIQHAERFEANKAKPPKKQQKNMVGPVDEYGSGIHAERPGDAFVAAETKSLKGRLFTLDHKTRSRAANLGTDIAPESHTVASVPAAKGQADINRARRLLELPVEPARVDTPTTQARVTAAARPTAAKRTGLRLIRRINGRAVISVGGVVVNFAMAIGLHFLEKWMTERDLKQTLEAGLKKAHAKIESALAALAPEVAKRQLKWYGWETMFVRVHLEVHNITKSLGAGRGTYPDVEVKLVGVSLSQETFSKEWTYDVRGGKADARIYSFEAAIYTKEEIAAFRKLSEQRNANEIRLAKDPKDEIYMKRRELIRQDMIVGYGREILDMEENYNPIQAEAIR